MNIPKGMTENEVVQIINKVVYRLAYKFRFGYHDIDDMKQQGRLLAIKALASGKYDGKRPLENFLWTHVHNRLFNFKRDNFERPNTPCDSCSKLVNGECSVYDIIKDCPLHTNWVRRNDAKKNLMKPLDLSGINDEEESSTKHFDNIVKTLMYKELIDIIDEKLPVTLRKDWLLCKKDVHIPKNRRIKLQQAILVILEEAGINAKEAWEI